MSHLQGVGMTSLRTRERLVATLRAQGITDSRVLDVIRTTPRHIFVEEALGSRAYENTALPIGCNQTLSQPYVVARMTEALLAAGMPDSVLEIGTGSGYQTAILAQLVKTVYTLERIEALQSKARERLRELGLRNCVLRHADGSKGWPEKGPFDAIMVTAAPTTTPDVLLDQLAPGGRLVIPVGESGSQDLKLYTRENDQFRLEILDAVRFVPLQSGTL